MLKSKCTRGWQLKRSALGDKSGSSHGRIWCSADNDSCGTNSKGILMDPCTKWRGRLAWANSNWIIHITHHTSHIIHHTSYIIHHTSHITRHTSHIIHHTSHIIHHISHITHHTSHITHHTHHNRLWGRYPGMSLVLVENQNALVFGKEIEGAFSQGPQLHALSLGVHISGPIGNLAGSAHEAVQIHGTQARTECCMLLHNGGSNTCCFGALCRPKVDVRCTKLHHKQQTTTRFFVFNFHSSSCVHACVPFTLWAWSLRSKVIIKCTPWIRLWPPTLLNSSSLFLGSSSTPQSSDSVGRKKAAQIKQVLVVLLIKEHTRVIRR